MNETKKVVINACFGGFSVSEAALQQYAKIKGIELWIGPGKFMKTFWTVPPEERQTETTPLEWHEWPLEQRQAWNTRYAVEHLSATRFEREDPTLIQVIEEMGAAANGPCANLGVIEIPEDVQYVIEEYDGFEHIAEVHRTWP
jgi:hypothetical protein